MKKEIEVNVEVQGKEYLVSAMCNFDWDFFDDTPYKEWYLDDYEIYKVYSKDFVDSEYPELVQYLSSTKGNLLFIKQLVDKFYKTL